MCKFKTILFSLVVFILGTSAVFAQNKTISPDGFWLEIDAASLAGKEPLKKIPPSSFRVFSLDNRAIRAFLKSAPMEFTAEARVNPYVITLPMPDGTFQSFRIEESPIMENGLAEKFPEIRTYRGYGIDDPTATVRFDLTSSGFHSMILSAGETVLVDPYASGDTENYISYFKHDAHRTGEFICDFKENKPNIFKVDTSFLRPFGEFENVTSGTTLRTYRLALAASNEYTVVFGNTIAGAMTAMTTTMNRVNGVYERDLAIHMNMVANNNLIVYAGNNLSCGGACTGANDPYTNTNGSTMLGQNTTTLNSVIGSANYDIGHVFSTGGGGVATLNGPCGGNKARGVTGSPSPSGDGYDIDYVAHEMGHQFGGNHTFNGTASNCGGGNRNATTAYETGSGITIMAYAGICTNQDLAAHSIDTFHVRSLEEIVAFSQTGAGNTCDVETATGNTVPAVSVVGGTSWNIPINTPFALTAAATDANGDSITYDWQEYDIGSSSGSTVPNTDASGGAKPIFRPYSPTTSGTRYFPSLTYILNNANVPPSTSGACPAGACLTGELLPAITRTMTFQVVARDNRANGGGINTATATVNVSATSGPFAVTAPNTAVSWPGNTNQTVTWNVASTTGAPVSAANVKISLSTDGGNTFPTVLLASTPNDGTQSALIPNSPTTTARIKVEGVGNIFFDVSNTNFTITQATAANVSIGGRVVTQNGYGIAHARVFLTSTSGEVISAGTNPFGYFLFDNVPSGFYIITAQSKRYQFESSTLQANDNVQDFTIVALPSGLK